jgi:hypothetical protein
MCAEEKQTRASRPFSLNPTGTLSRRVPAQFVCAVDIGQSSTTLSDATQVTETQNFLNGAKNSCFSSALAWKYESTSQPWFSYLYITNSGGLGGTRPAYTTFKNFVP